MPGSIWLDYCPEAEEMVRSPHLIPELDGLEAEELERKAEELVCEGCSGPGPECPGVWSTSDGN